MLRNEEPVYIQFTAGRAFLGTSAEPIGEGEKWPSGETTHHAVTCRNFLYHKACPAKTNRRWINWQKQSQADPAMNDRILEKLNLSKEALAEMQCQEAMELVEAGFIEDALELFALATELTADPQLKAELTQQIQKAALQQRPGIQESTAFIRDLSEAPEDNVIEEDADGYFNILLGALPNEVQHVYRRYGPDFKRCFSAEG